MIRWHRYLHLPGVQGLPEVRAALTLAGRLATPVPPPELPALLREHAASTAPRRRWGPRGRNDSAERFTIGLDALGRLVLLMERFEDHREPSVLQKVVETQNAWLAAGSVSAREQAALLTDGARLALMMGSRDGGTQWFVEAERVAGLAVENTTLGERDPHMANRLVLRGTCAAALYKASAGPDWRHHEGADPAALERAVVDVRRAVVLAGQCTPADLYPARTLTAILARLHERTGSADTLAQALAAARDLVRATAVEDRRAPEHEDWLAELRDKAAVRLGVHAVNAVMATGPTADEPSRLNALFDIAEDPHAAPQDRRAAALTLVGVVPADHEDRPWVLILASKAELLYGLQDSDRAAINQALAWAVSATQAVPPGHPLCPRALIALADARVRAAAASSATPDEALADAAVVTARKAKGLLPPGDADNPMLLDQLAKIISTAAGLLSDPSLQPEWVAMRREAMTLTPAGDPFRPFRQTTLATCLRGLAEASNDPAMSDEAVALARQAADSLPDDHPQKRELVYNLASQLGSSVRKDHAAERLAEAAHALRKGLAMLPAGHPDRPRFQSRLSEVLHLLHQETGDQQTLIDAAELARDAVANTPTGDTWWGVRNACLAKVCTALHRLSGATHEALRAEAMDAWAVVAANRETACYERIGAYEQRAALAHSAGDPGLALRELEAALADVPPLARRSLAGPLRRGTTRRSAELAASAAVAAIDVGRPDYAVELLENGRAVLYGQAVAARRYWGPLQRFDPQAAKRLEEIDNHLAKADIHTNVEIEVSVRRRDVSGRVTETSATLDDQRPKWAATTRQLAAERDRILQRLAQRPDFAEMMRPQSLRRIRELIAGAPVVLIMARKKQGHALLVPPDPSHPVEHIPLPGLTEAAVLTRITQLDTAVADATDPQASFDHREWSQSTVHDVLEWLWDQAASPVLDRLAPPGPGCALPRMWWCPVGPLVRLPLHAAGHHRSHPSRAARTVMDRVTPSYTPTLAALAHALRDHPRSSPDRRHPGALVVAVSDAPNLPRLPQAQTEARDVLALIPGSRLLSARETNLSTLEVALRDHPLVHFACHGENGTDASSLLGNGLHLASGEALTAAHVGVTRLDHGALAFLSACSTAEAHTTLPDEPMNLASAFQLAGFRSVIGTLWRAPDSPAVARAVYTTLTTNGTRPPDTSLSAEALNSALRTARDTYPATPTRWAAYLHSGA